MPDGTIAVIAPLAAGKERGEFVMADEKDGKSRTAAATARGRARSARAGALVSVVREEPEQGQAVEVPAQTRSGVVPVLFSASAEAHDVAVAAPDQGADWRSPFGAPLRHASGE
ncbi:hypothetical protein G3I59_27935 [Amycolatopsis rubida]|uniref:Uncharacterized protein n=1 Tax=Amycolatopsis rubida TaxID=112413 RepID=A0ABX0BXW2_9PSEU|nr:MULTISPECIES: hypothetical protein [Amycolatopsis]MYW94326.1 hypothetical protein [Amycolatopsis rubida]NEC59315.1 hypothetical protein [Amycolatopsis rubida]OAP24742.1 hypothetical protein A4R44_04712 [Amycolatopsis sp. M39]